MNSLESIVSRVERPFSKVFYCLSPGKLICKRCLLWSRGKKRICLEGHHWSWEETKCASMHLETLQNIWRVEESYHSNPKKKQRTTHQTENTKQHRK